MRGRVYKTIQAQIYSLKAFGFLSKKFVKLNLCAIYTLNSILTKVFQKVEKGSHQVYSSLRKETFQSMLAL